MNKARITVFSNVPPTPRQSEIIIGLRQRGIEPMLDSTHKAASWFVYQFSDLVHKVFYTSPCILHGSITETRFDLMGSHPDIVIYYPAGSRELESEEWETVSRFLDSCINKVLVEEATLTRAMSLLGVCAVKPDEFEEIEIDDDLVVLVDANDHYYSYEYKTFDDIDTILCQITRPRESTPYLVVVKDYSRHGIEQFFYDIFTDDTWGRCESDAKFIKKLWDKFMLGEFDMDKILDTASVRQFPPRGKEKAIVHRTSIEDFEQSDTFTLLSTKLGGLKL